MLYNTNYAFDGWIIRAPAFFLFFFIKNKKAGPARKMMWVFILFILLVKNLLLRTDAIPYSPIFIYKRLYVLCGDNSHYVSYVLHIPRETSWQVIRIIIYLLILRGIYMLYKWGKHGNLWHRKVRFSNRSSAVNPWKGLTI